MTEPKGVAPFLELLEREAKRQAALNKHSPLPKSLQRVSAFVALHVWQVSSVLAIITAFFIEMTRYGL